MLERTSGAHLIQPPTKNRAGFEVGSKYLGFICLIIRYVNRPVSMLSEKLDVQLGIINCSGSHCASHQRYLGRVTCHSLLRGSSHERHCFISHQN